MRVTGLPAELGDTLFVEVAADTLTGYTLIERTGEGALLRAPVHPGGSLEGGPVELRITGERAACPALAFTVEPLDPAPGTVASVVAELRAHLGLRLRFLGTTRAELREADPDTLAGPLVALRVAHYLLDHPDNPRSAAALLAADDGAGEGEGRLALIDALWARAGVAEALRERLDTLRARGPMPPPASGTRSARGPRARGVAPRTELAGGWRASLASYRPPGRLAGAAASPTRDLLLNRWDATPRALSELMWQAFLSDLQTSGSTAEFTSNLETALGLAAAASVAVNPLVAAGFAAAGTAVMVNRIIHEGFANTLPRRFTRMTVEPVPAVFEEDNPGPGAVRRITVVAVSEGWNFDATIVSKVLGKIPIPGGKAASALSTKLMDLIAGPVHKAVADAARDSRWVSVPPQYFGPVDISDREWRRINVIGAAVDPVGGGEIFDYAPRRAGAATLRVATAPNKFGLGDGQYIAREIPLRVLPISVTVDPPSTYASPGDTVTLTATVSDALSPTVGWSVTGGGTLVDEEFVGFAGTRVRVRVPDPFDGPVVVTARSLADRSHLRLAPERSGAATIRPRRLTIRPRSGGCVPYGATREFGLDEVPAGDARWSASGGSITPEGVFTAPRSTGTVTIRAVSIADPDLRDEVEIEVAEACASPCTFEAEVTWPDARHSYTGTASINDAHHTLSLVADESNWSFTVDIGPLGIGERTGRISSRTVGGRYRVDLAIEENADPGRASEWLEMETVGETMESVRESGLGLPDRLALRRLRGELDARFVARSGSGATRVEASFDAGHVPYGCGEDSIERAEEYVDELLHDADPDRNDPSKLDRLMGGGPPDGDG